MSDNVYEDSGFYLYASDHVIRQPESTLTGMAEQALELLLDCDWTEVRRFGVAARTRWTVMQHNSSGCPEVIATEAADGRLMLTDNKRQP